MTEAAEEEVGRLLSSGTATRRPQPEQVRAWAERIRVRAVDTETMPPANRTWMTAEERDVLRRWTAAGAPLER
jgi:uncharacterized membrane protein